MAGDIMPVRGASSSGSSATANEAIENLSEYLTKEVQNRSVVLSCSEFPVTINADTFSAKSRVIRPYILDANPTNPMTFTIIGPDNSILSQITESFPGEGQITPPPYAAIGVSLIEDETSNIIVDNRDYSLYAGYTDSLGQAVGLRSINMRLNQNYVHVGWSGNAEGFNLIDNAVNEAGGLTKAEYEKLYVHTYRSEDDKLGKRDQLISLFDPYDGYKYLGSTGSVTGTNGSIPNGTVIEYVRVTEFAGVYLAGPVGTFTITSTGGVTINGASGSNIVFVDRSLPIRENVTGTTLYRIQGDSDWRIGGSGFTATLVTALPLVGTIASLPIVTTAPVTTVGDLPLPFVGQAVVNTEFNVDGYSVAIVSAITATERVVGFTQKDSSGYWKFFHTSDSSLLSRLRVSDIRNSGGQPSAAFTSDEIYVQGLKVRIEVTIPPAAGASGIIGHLSYSGRSYSVSDNVNGGTLVFKDIPTTILAVDTTNTTDSYPPLYFKPIGTPDWTGDLVLPVGSSILFDCNGVALNGSPLTIKIPVQY